MKTIHWTLSIGYPSAMRLGSFSVDDALTDADIEELAREEAMNYVEWNWHAEDDEDWNDE